MAKQNTPTTSNGNLEAGDGQDDLTNFNEDDIQDGAGFGDDNYDYDNMSDEEIDNMTSYDESDPIEDGDGEEDDEDDEDEEEEELDPKAKGKSSKGKKPSWIDDKFWTGDIEESASKQHTAYIEAEKKITTESTHRSSLEKRIEEINKANGFSNELEAKVGQIEDDLGSKKEIAEHNAELYFKAQVNTGKMSMYQASEALGRYKKELEDSLDVERGKAYKGINKDTMERVNVEYKELLEIPEINEATDQLISLAEEDGEVLDYSRMTNLIKMANKIYLAGVASTKQVAKKQVAQNQNANAKQRLRSLSQKGSGTASANNAGAKPFTVEQIERMSPEEYDKHRDRIHAQFYGKRKRR